MDITRNEKKFEKEIFNIKYNFLKRICFDIHHKILSFIHHNFTGCTYCNPKKAEKLAKKIFGETLLDKRPECFNTLLDGYCNDKDNQNLTAYFYPILNQIRVYDNSKKDFYLTILTDVCPVCGRKLKKYF